ncbi:MAG: ferrous iron transporter B [Eggerthellales bacterium]|nr:ferrous iron transporter B [Eggerthellales bacterium]
MRFALAGNPNCGKTTLFNALTGSNQHVGNWPGVTVEKKEGACKANKDFQIVDLPGIYSLSPYTLEEVVARNFIIQERPDAIINIIDGSNLERNLYLTTQILELGLPVLVAINMMDVVRKNGDTINIEALREKLGAADVIEISALKGEGIDKLVATLPGLAAKAAPTGMAFSSDIEPAVKAVTAKLPDSIDPAVRRFYAVKLLEGDEKIGEGIEGIPDISAQVKAIESATDDTAESAIINERYEWIGSIIDDVAVRGEGGKGESISDKIDRIVTNRILALPIFAVVMFLVYFLSVSTVGAVATDWANDGVFGDGWFLDPAPIVGIDGAQAAFDEVNDAFEEASAIMEAGIGGTIEAYDDETGEAETITVTAEMMTEASETLTEMGGEAPDPSDFGIWIPGIPVLLENLTSSLGLEEDSWVHGLLFDGIVAGLGAMLGFLPQMAILFLLLSFLELCGYTSRVAFILDRIFRRFGLSGKSFIPLLISSGCGVPGVMASRTIENLNDRRMTVMTATFVPCGAKLPFIALIAGAVFGGAWWVAPCAYFMGIVCVLLSGIILKKFKFFAGEATPFVMELPAYHLPSARSVLHATGERCMAFVKKAVTVLLLATIVIWFLSTYGFGADGFGAVEDQGDSLLAAIGGAIAWIFKPLGWGTWQATAASIVGITAKENIVGTLGILYECPEGWYAAVQAAFGAAAGFSYLAFNLLCIPCFAAMAAILKEMGGIKWAAAAWGYECLTAYVVAFLCYQFMGLATGECVFGLGTVIAVVLVAAILYLLFRPNKYAQKKLAE